jgi:uncharacterized protein (TIGR03067 family)
MTRFALLLLAICPIAAAPKADEETSDVKKLQGTWVLASGQDDGEKLSEEVIKNSRLVFDGTKHTVREGDTTYKGSHKLDSATKPKTIDIMDTEGPFKGKTVLGIYELEGDTFKICYALPGKDRPRDFSAGAGTGLRCHTWKRVKK